MNEKEYQHQYYLKNKEKLKAYRRDWAKKNKERLKAKLKEKSQTNDLYYNNLIEYKKNWHLKNREKNPVKYLVDRARRRASTSGIEHTITEKDLQMPEVCPIMKVPFSYLVENTSPSIDRIDNSKGYVPGNVWIISTLANRMKQTATKEQLITFAKGILEVQDHL